MVSKDFEVGDLQIFNTDFKCEGKSLNCNGFISMGFSILAAGVGTVFCVKNGYMQTIDLEIPNGLTISYSVVIDSFLAQNNKTFPRLHLGSLVLKIVQFILKFSLLKIFNWMVTDSFS